MCMTIGLGANVRTTPTCGHVLVPRKGRDTLTRVIGMNRLENMSPLPLEGNGADMGRTLGSFDQYCLYVEDSFLSVDLRYTDLWPFPPRTLILGGIPG